MSQWDVLVAGGGSAGLAAAVAAARVGARTLLIERGGLLGGMGSQSFVHTICGLYELREEAGGVLANDGFAPEFAQRLQRCGGARGPVRMGRLDVLPHDPVMFAALGDEFVSATGNLEVWLHAELCSASASGAHLEEIEIVCRGRRESVSSSAFVDATGDASLTALAGADFAQSEASRLQRPAYVALLRGLEAELLEEEGRLQLAHRIATAVKAGQLPVSALGAGFRAAVSPDEAFLTIDLAGDLNAEPWDPTSPRLLAGVEITGRRTALAIARHLNCRVTAWPARAGVRESRRATGVYELSESDVLQGAEFPDGVVSAAWPMELRERPTGPRWRFPESSRGARIPLRCLRHRELENLWLAGRCISASHEAQSAIRVIGTCLAMGEAAGLAAAEMLQSPETRWEVLAGRVMRSREFLKRSC